MQAVLDLLPQRRAAQRALDALVEVGLHLEVARRPGDVVVDRLGKGVGPLEDHADAPAHLDRIDLRAVDVVAVVEDLALDRGSPVTESFMRLRLRRKVVLPQPEGPMMAVIRLRVDLQRHARDRRCAP